MNDAQVSNPKVSILIPVFNRQQFIAECIRSALNQTFKNIEVVVVDNASDDGTWEICQKFSAIDNRVRIFRNDTNIGPVRNWLRCGEEAKGEFVKILFSDDTLEPNCIKEMLAKFDRENVRLVFCSALIGRSKDSANKSYEHADGTIFDQNRYLEAVINGAAPLSPGAIMLRNEDLSRNLRLSFDTSVSRRYSEHGAGPDLMLSVLTLEGDKYAVSVNTALVFFRSHLGSFSIGKLRTEVRDSYRSVLACFIKNKYRPIVFRNYIAIEWLKECKYQKSLVGIRGFSKTYEGTGSVKESVQVLCASAKMLLLYVLGKRFILG